MVRVVDCHAEVLGSNPGGPKRLSPWNYFNGVRNNSVMLESASGSGIKGAIFPCMSVGTELSLGF